VRTRARRGETLDTLENERRSPATTAFGKLLRRHRLAAGLSQEALAERARISIQGLGALERGERRTPQRETLALLIAALNLSAEERESLVATAARQSAPRPDKASVTAGPWPAAPSSNLPLSLTSFVGRESETVELAALLREHRLVTLVGVGGVGKTRLALEVATAIDAAARFVELAPLVDAAPVTAAIASALGVQEVPNCSLLETLVAHLQQKKVLLVLDNCEHVVDETARVAEKLLRGAAGVTVLATSREVLRVAGEVVYRLEPLAAPAAVELFAERARAAEHRFLLDDGTAPAVAAICARLDGIPLAIELAAARVNVLGVSAIAERLERRLSVLSRRPQAAGRQQTMRAAIEWSYDLLDDAERRTFERFSVFAGGCRLESAVSVCSRERETDAFEALASLVDKSLVVAGGDDGGARRYRMLEPFREYAREKLLMRGELAATMERYAQTYLELARGLEAVYETTPDPQWLSQVEPELQNWRAVLEWALGGRADVTTGQRLCGSLHPVWRECAEGEGRRWVRLALELVDEQTPSDIVAALKFAQARMAAGLIENDLALEAAGEALARYVSLGDHLGAARAQYFAGLACSRQGRHAEAEPLLREALATARALGRTRMIGDALRWIAAADGRVGNLAAARAGYAESLEVCRALESEAGAARVMYFLAESEFAAGDAEAAARHATEALGIWRARDNAQMVAGIVANLAAYEVALGRYDLARLHAREALTLARSLRVEQLGMRAILNLAAAAACEPVTADDGMDQRRARAARLLGFFDAHGADWQSEAAESVVYGRLVEALARAFPPDELRALRDAGAALSEDAAVALALDDA